MTDPADTYEALATAPQPPAEAQAQGGGDVVAWWNPDAEFSDPFSQSQTRKHRIALYAAPPSAPVGVEELDAAAVEAGHIAFESMKQCADAWLAVVDALSAAAPGWSEKNGTGRECATAAIAALASQAVGVKDGR